MSLLPVTVHAREIQHVKLQDIKDMVNYFAIQDAHKQDIKPSGWISYHFQGSMWFVFNTLW